MLIEPIPFDRNKKLDEYARILNSRGKWDKVKARNKNNRTRAAKVVKGVGKVAKGVARVGGKVVRFIPRPLWDAGATAVGTYFGNPEAGYLAGEVIRAGARKLAGDPDEPLQKKQMDEAIGSVVSRGMKRAARDQFGSLMEDVRKNVGSSGVPRYWHNTYDSERLGPRIGPNARTGYAGMDWEEPPVWPDPDPMSASERSYGSRPMSHKSYSSSWEPYSRMDYTERSFGSRPMSFARSKQGQRGVKRTRLSPKVKKQLAARRALIPALEM